MNVQYHNVLLVGLCCQCRKENDCKAGEAGWDGLMLIDD